MRVMMIAPPYRLLKRKTKGYKNIHRRAQPILGMLSIVTNLRNQGHKAKYLDATIEGIDNTFSYDDLTECYGLTNQQILERVKEYNPDVVGISCMFSSQHNQVKTLARDIKAFNPNIEIVVGGNHPTLNGFDSEHVDRVFKGEGDLGIEGTDRVRIDNLDDIPLLDYDLVPLKDYWEKALPQNPFAKSRKTILYESSRGCPEKCTYCSTKMFFGNKFRAKSANKVIEEIVCYVTRHGVEEVHFVDDNIALDKKRFMAILDGIKLLKINLCAPSGVRLDYYNDRELDLVFKKMKDAGFYQITLAVESGNKDTLRKIRKRLDLDRMSVIAHKAKDYFRVHGFFIIGFPHETELEMEDTIKYMDRFDSVSLSLATPFPPTDLWQQCQEDNLLNDTDCSNYILGKSVIRHNVDLERKAKDVLSAFQKKKAKLNTA